MKLKLHRKEGKTVGYSLVPETHEEKLELGTLRNVYFFDLNGGFKYGGVRSEDTEEGSLVKELIFGRCENQ